MVKNILRGVLGLALVGVAYLLLWPVPIDPVAWEAPPSPGFQGVYAPNGRLKALEMLSLGAHQGPEDVAVDREGRVYVATQEGVIVRLEADGSRPQDWARTGGRPLGLQFDRTGNLIVADAERGLLSVAPDGAVAVLATEADGLPINYADGVDVGADGHVYVSDATTKFGSRTTGTLGASLLELMEHGGNGRLLVYDPATRKATTLLKGLTFANGVAVDPGQQFVLVNETGAYRVIRYWIAGARKGQSEPLIDALPGFPDNISAGTGGRFWIGLVNPRNPTLDGLAGMPFLRKIVQRLPAFLRPAPVPYGHVIAVNAQGQVLVDLQDPQGAYPMTTGARESATGLYITSLSAPSLGRLARANAGF